MTSTLENPQSNDELQPGGNPNWPEIYKVRHAIDLAIGSVNLACCSPREEPDDHHGCRFIVTYDGPDPVKAFWDGLEWVCLWPGEEVRAEYDGYWGNWLVLAWSTLICGRSAVWKNVRMLATLRQSFRENWAQGMGLDLPPAGAGRTVITKFLNIARHFDAVHHGEETF